MHIHCQVLNVILIKPTITLVSPIYGVDVVRICIYLHVYVPGVPFYRGILVKLKLKPTFKAQLKC
mgnify:CR=1 FL=1